MIVEQEFYIGFKDCRGDLKAKNSSLLTFCENVAGIHGSLAKDSIRETLTSTFATWVLISWRLKVIKRPEHGEHIKVRTWVTGFKRIYSYREFEIISESGEVIAKCLSKWAHISTNTLAPIRVTDELAEKYSCEDKTNFEAGTEVIIKEPEGDFCEYERTVEADWIDMNFHMNNTWYVTLTHLAFEKNGMEFPESSSLEVLYKKEIRQGETVKCCVYKMGEGYISVIKSLDGSTVHALLSLEC